MSHKAPITIDPAIRASWATDWGLPAPAIEHLMEAATYRTYPPRTSILPQGSSRSTVFFVLQGEVSVSVYLPDGRRVLCALYQPGTIFGFPLVDKERPRWSSADAFTEAKLALVSRGHFERVLHTLPAGVVADFFNRLLMRQARFAMRLLHCMVLDLPGRLALALIELADAFGQPSAEGLQITLPLTHEHLAEMVGASRERVSKAMAEFAHRGILQYKRYSITLRDLDALRRAATPRANPLA
ncbi:MAG: Crp/Fnr family transcriptional regulator [Candidatus Binatia bacterium]|nr:Crp/Fnr family transcriptional regulator [Candidatus Binatia bacterium]